VTLEARKIEATPSAPVEIGPYRLLGLLGRGGMAEVFMAEHRHLAQVRAVKILLPEIAARPGVVERLLNEARATVRLRHPAIVEVFDCDTLPQGGAFIAMEYLEGQSVAAWLERSGPLGDHPELAVALIGTVAEALAFAHRHGVVHRDLKPENLFLIPDPRHLRRFSVKVLDFGVAKLTGEDSLVQTRDGAVIGTPLYMAPEQWRPGLTTDHRTDVYSLGCVLFELLCGRPPFAGVDTWDVMRAHLMDNPPDLTVLLPGLPPALSRLVSRMLSKEPDDRPASMEDVAAELAATVGCQPAGLPALLVAPSHAPVLTGDPQRPAMMRPAPTVLSPLRGMATRVGDGLSRTQMMVRRRLGRWTTASLVGAVAAAVALTTIAVAHHVSSSSASESRLQASPPALPEIVPPAAAMVAPPTPAAPPAVQRAPTSPARAKLLPPPVPIESRAPERHRKPRPTEPRTIYLPMGD
jgi:tRNA A-37 threonylcarbamoyl transferase component Bud32